MANADTRRGIRRGILLAEDEALKAKLSDIVVPIKGGSQRVKVWFGQPDREKVRSYPYITIDLIDIVFANDRAHSAQITPVDYWPSEYASMAEYYAAQGVAYDPAVQSAQAVWWHPYDLIYQVTTYTRNSQHDRAITATLLRTAYFPPSQWGYLPVPADQSYRWLDRVGFSNNDYYEQAGDESKRVFSKVYNLAISAHIPPALPFAFLRVQQLHGLLHDIQEPGFVATNWLQPITS